MNVLKLMVKWVVYKCDRCFVDSVLGAHYTIVIALIMMYSSLYIGIYFDYLNIVNPIFLLRLSFSNQVIHWLELF